MNKTPTIELRNVVIGYKNTNYNDFSYPEISIQTNAYEFIALIGRNGVGKSTLMRSISKLQKTISGEIFISGKPISNTSHKTLSQLISYIPAEPAHSANTSVYNFVSLARYPYHGWFNSLTENDHKLISKGVEIAGLQKLVHRELNLLSDGERQRAMIAFAIAQDTPIVLMDEPTAFLDVPNKLEILRLLKELSSTGKTIIISTHDITTVINIVDTMWLMLPEGIEVGAPEDIVINNKIDKLLTNTPITYNVNTGGFQYNKIQNSNAKIISNNKIATEWTKRALERNGYRVIDNNSELIPELILEISECESKYNWQIMSDRDKPKFQSLREVFVYLKNVKENF